MKRTIERMKTLLRLIGMPEMKILPGQIAFFLVLSLIPIITLVGFLASFFSISIESAINFVSNLIPPEITEILLPFISGKGMDGNVAVFMTIGFFLASNGPHAIIVACDTLYRQETSTYVQTRIKALVLTTILMLLFFFCLIVLAFGDSIFSFMMNWEILSNIKEQLYTAYLILKYPFAFILVFLMIKMLYTMAPSKKIPSRTVNKGSFFTTVMWLSVTYIYSIYISHFSSYDLFYGGLSNIIMMMIWVYILSYVLVIGIAINASKYQYDKELEKSSLNKVEEIEQAKNDI